MTDIPLSCDGERVSVELQYSYSLCEQRLTVRASVYEVLHKPLVQRKALQRTETATHPEN